MFLIFQSPHYDIGGGGGEVSGLEDAGRWLPWPSRCLWPPTGHPQQVLTDVQQLGWNRSTGPIEGERCPRAPMARVCLERQKSIWHKKPCSAGHIVFHPLREGSCGIEPTPSSCRVWWPRGALPPVDHQATAPCCSGMTFFFFFKQEEHLSKHIL